MGDILDEAASLVECHQCPWYKSCVTPMKLSVDDLKRDLQRTMPGVDPVRQQEFYNLMINSAAMAQNTHLEGCPIFIERLKSSSRLAEHLKKIMQDWGKDEQSQP